jgi:hypothetical protein
MSAAILQGCPATTLDTDLWMDLPPHGYMRLVNHLSDLIHKIYQREKSRGRSAIQFGMILFPNICLPKSDSEN